MHELIAVLIPDQEGACKGGIVGGVVDRELERLAGLNLGFGYDSWYPVDPEEWLRDPLVTTPPARGEVESAGRAGRSYAYPVFFAEDMVNLGIHLGAIVAPDGGYHRDWERPGNGASGEDYELFDRHRDCLVVVCGVHI